jgi:hypothetical protein
MCKVKQEPDPKLEDKEEQMQIKAGVPGFYPTCSYLVSPSEVTTF